MSLHPYDAESVGGFFSWVFTRLMRPQPEATVEVRPWLPAGDYPHSFSDVVGHGRTVALLQAEVAACRRDRRVPRPILFVGPPGTGKTALCHVLAAEAGMAVFESSGPEFLDQKATLMLLDQVVEAWKRNRRPAMLVIDEIDAMQRAASYVLHSWFTHGHCTWAGHRFYAGLQMSVCATTNLPSKVPPALRSRFAEVLHIDFLSPEDLAEVARKAASQLGLTITGEAAAWFGANSGGEPRKALHLVRGAANLAAGAITLETAERSLALSGLYPGGLSETQRRYLEYLAGTESGVAGLTSLAAFVATSPADLQAGEECYLIRSRAVEVTSKGRRITDRGRALAVGA